MDSAFQLAYKNIGVVIFLLLSTALATINASIHIYQNQLFNEVGNAYLLPGGSEGLAASISSDDSATDGRSFIRFENITFWRTKAAADEHSEMEHSTGLIQAVIFEAADRNNIGGSAYGGQRSICCTPDLAKLEGCKQGMRPVVITTWVVTVGAIRKTLSRLLILSVAMGYGVVRPTLGGLTSKVVLLGATYFLASELLDITEYVGTINDISGRARLFLVLPDAFLDAFLILWIFTSLSKTLEQLQAKRTSIKLDLYRKFSNALAVAVIASVAWISYEVYFKATDPFNERWQSAWIITAFWDILAFVLLCVICYLWAPSQSSQRYAYSEDMGEEFDDEEAQSLTRGQPDGDVGLVKQERKNGNAGLSDEEDDSEEDKRE
ncbi:Transmembrane receptor, eukaryota [Corchorus capsularis]|uniref:Transmembrane receptor, eukaryota n=1 Tax=Corchorus capsularis TaxID=210143 RepID=A0A1R3IBK6_COCAP|nr:Transmembrane receptor, eukaryota [Corchorus capsularis]